MGKYALILLFISLNTYSDDLINLRNEQGTVNLTVGDDSVSSFVTLPFTFNYYDVDFTTAKMSSNGCLSFTSLACQDYNPSPLPYEDYIMYPFWTDLINIDNGKMLYKAYQDKAVFGWYDMSEYYDSAHKNNFEVILYNDNSYEFRYGILNITNHNVLIGSQGGAGEIDQRLWLATSNNTNFNNTNIITGTSFMFNVPIAEEEEPVIPYFDDNINIDNIIEDVIDNFDSSLASQDLSDPINQDISMTGIEISESVNYDISQTGYDIFENVGMTQEDVYGFDLNEPITEQQVVDQIIPDDFIVSIADNIDATINVNLLEIAGVDVLGIPDGIPDLIFDVITETAGMPDELNDNVLNETVDLERFFFQDNTDTAVVDKEDTAKQDTEYKVERKQETAEENQTTINDDIGEQGIESFLSETTIEELADVDINIENNNASDSLADTMSDATIEDNMSTQANEVQDSGGFSDQSTLIAAVGYKKGFSDYKSVTLQDKSGWYETEDIYPGVTNTDNAMSYYRMIGADSKFSEMVRSQYDR
tara:strand:- start:918 stop:2519 length:1602 start_codon:yes stop_codon:yes gene_type:complete